MSANQIYEFGRFRLDPAERLLLRDGKPVPLTPKAFDTLLVLVEQGGRLVRKDDLMERVWPDAFVEEVNLAQNVSAIRRALDSIGEQYVETVAKVGYRLSMKVRVQSDSAGPAEEPRILPAPAGTTAHSETAQATAKKRRVNEWRTRGAIAAVTLVGVGVVALLSWRFTARPAAPTPIRSIVVLPLKNLSGDAQQEYFADGITEALTTEVARIGGLRVISGTTATRYKNTSYALREIARELRVDVVVEGAVVRSGDRVRITAQLIRADSDEHIWAQSYDRNLIDALAVQSDIAQDIAKQIKLQVTPGEKGQKAKRPPPSVEAQDAYLRGRYEWNKRGQNLLRARAFFQQALDRDPTYALAWDGLADTEFLLTNVQALVPPQEGMPRAKAAAQRPLELDDSLGAAHASLGMVKWAYDRDWPAAEQEYKRALELSPSYATAHQFYSIGLASQARFEEAIAEAKHALELDPLSSTIELNLSRMYYSARRYDEAITISKKVVEREPDFGPGHCWMGVIAAATGRTEEAITHLQRLRELEPDQTLILMHLARAYARSGQRPAALAALEELRQIAKQRYVPPSYFAVVYAELGESDAAFQWLERAVEEERSGAMMQLKVEPVFDALRPDPRFAQLVRRIGPA